MVFENDNRGKKSSRVQNQKTAHLGKLPPQDCEAEEIVLGTVLLMANDLIRVIDLFKPEIFYRDNHQRIAEAILTLHKKSAKVDVITIMNQLRKTGELEMVGGAYYLTQLTERVSNSVHLQDHIRIVYEHYIRREIIRHCTEQINKSYEMADPFDMISETAGFMDKLQQGVLTNVEVTTEQLAIEAVKDRQENKGVRDILGITTGSVNLDKAISGLINGQLIVVGGRPAMGKCLGRGTKVIMFDGTLKKVEDIKPGEQLMGVDSTPRNVLSIARGREQMYWVRQNKGIDYRVNESHILSLKRSGSEGTATHGEVINICVKDYLKRSDKFKIRNKGYKGKIEFEEQSLLVDPYFLGLWLGDGYQENQNIANPDIEIVEYLKGYCDNNDLSFLFSKYAKKCPKLSLRKKEGINNKLKDSLSEIGVINNKHIPHQYIQNSRHNRLQLLAGLIDTDGYFQHQSNLFEIMQVRENLAYQIKYLCHTLGFACTIKKVKKGIKSRGFISDYYRLIISGDLHEIPTKVKRKKAPVSKNTRNVLVTGIKVEKDIIDDYYGFVLDGDHLYMLEDCTVTHNTAFALSIVKSIGVTVKKPVAVFSLEMTAKQLYTRLQASVSQIESHKIRLNKLDAHEAVLLDETDGKLSGCPIIIDDTPALNIDLFRAKATIMKHKYGIQAIVVDYLQLMKGSKGNFNREAEISEISGKLKQVAKELDIPVIALSQLSRSVESRAGTGKIPQLSDLRESGSIEQDADVVLFLHRPEYYDQDQAVHFGHFNTDILPSNLLTIIIAKQREGDTYSVPLHITLKTMTIKDHPALTERIQANNEFYHQPVMFTPNLNEEEKPPF